MTNPNRRDFVRAAGLGATASLLPGLVARAAAIAPRQRYGSIEDVEHIVIFMQENRSFDHYLGMLNGVRGFGDSRPLRLAGDRTVWAQPSLEHPDGFVLPFHGDSKISRSFKVDGSGQSHQENIGIYHHGRFDRWGLSGELHKRMLHYTAGDLPFYYALADAFTVCDAYHCSTLTQTYPNRLHAFTGCNGGGTVGGDPQMTNYGEDETPSADMAQDKPLRPDAYRWTTYAERLQAAGVSWKVYQEHDNFGDNLLSVFPAFRPCAPDSALYARGRAWVSEHRDGPDRTRSDGEQLVAAFRRDVAAGTLPKVSWIVTAADLSEHPQAEPSRGEHVCAALIAVLVDHPEMFAKTVFIVNYDEAGGFYDHMPPPVPPVAGYRGASTVSLAGETKDYGDHPAEDDLRHPGQHPIGLGIRTPTIIVSPWSRGGFVCSELFDHTSTLRFIERRFGVREPNISAWRRSVCGDLTSAFDFTRRNGDTAALTFPATDDFRDRIARSAAGRLNAIPAAQAPTRQMTGQRPQRALPYRLEITGELTPAHRLQITFVNSGAVGATFTVHDNLDIEEPWNFTVGAGDRLSHDAWHHPGSIPSRIDVTVRGPNGLLHRYATALAEPAGPADADVVLGGDPGDAVVTLTLVNRGATPLAFQTLLAEPYATPGARLRQIVVPPHQSVTDRWSVARSDHWYDLTVTTPRDPHFLRRFAGKLDDGGAGRTDPAIGTMRLTA